MAEEGLPTPDLPRGELETTIRELIARAQRVLDTQGRLRQLLTATRVVTEPLDIEQVLIRIVKAAVDLARARYGAIGVRDQDGSLERFIHVGMDDEQVAAVGHLPEWRGLLGIVFHEGQNLRLAHIVDDPRSVGFPEGHPPMDSFLAVPVRVRDTVFGNLYLTDQVDGAFSDEDEALIESLAAAAGVAIENARLYEEARRHERLSKALSEISAALLDPGTEDVLALVTERLTGVVATELVTIVVPVDVDDWRIASAQGARAAGLTGILIPAASALGARAVESGEVVTGAFADQDTEHRIRGDRGAVLGPSAAVPLNAGGRPIGALCVSRDDPGRPFTRTELDTIEEFANQAGIALSLAWARRDRQQLEVIDERSRIARDLHDHVIQRLFATGLGLQALASAEPAAAARLDAHVAELDAAIAEIRTAIFTLRTRPAAGGAGLTRNRILDVIGELTPALGGSPSVTFTGAIDLTLTGAVADDVIAVVREGLANIARHARAQNTAVDVSVSEVAIVVTIEDDGDGVGSDATLTGGTANLRDRAESRGGEFSLRPRAAGGTRLEWRAPLPR
nr:GAF domain-containing protein [Microbacterium bovistercoris]